jgi:cytochrome c
MKRFSSFLIAVSLLSGASGAVAQTVPPDARGKGIGPVKDVKLGAIDTQMAGAGRKTFDAKCFVCHTLDARKIGPPLRQVAQQRAPEWIMNLLLNVNEMLAKDPEASKLRAQYPLSMTDQQLKQEEARQILEYLRQAAQEKTAK